MFIYAMGGGWGHLTRAAALARVALPRRLRILSNSPYAAMVRNRFPELDIIALDPAITVTAAREQVARHIRSSAAGCLIVDTFPRGLGGELPGVLSAFSGTRVLIKRDLNPEYSASAGLDNFIASFYDRVFVPGDADSDTKGAIVTAPWLIRSANELLPLDEARQVLQLADGQRCVVVCAAGNSDELAWYGEVVSQLRARDSSLAVRCVAPKCPLGCPRECWISYWPAMDLYPAANVVVGGAGYNTINECIACGVPLIARAWPRKYDRQSVRAARAAVITVEEPQDAASAALRQLAATTKQRRPEFPNGAEEAFLLLVTDSSRSSPPRQEP